MSNGMIVGIGVVFLAGLLGGYALGLARGGNGGPSPE